MKERRKPFDKYRYKVCPIFNHCADNKDKDGKQCIYCELSPGTSSLTFIKQELMFMTNHFALFLIHARLRFPRLTFFFKNMLLPFLIGLLAAFLAKKLIILI